MCLRFRLLPPNSPIWGFLLKGMFLRAVPKLLSLNTLLTDINRHFLALSRLWNLTVMRFSLWFSHLLKITLRRALSLLKVFCLFDSTKVNWYLKVDSRVWHFWVCILFYFISFFLSLWEHWHCNLVKSRRIRVLNLCEKSRTNFGRCVFKFFRIYFEFCRSRLFAFVQVLPPFSKLTHLKRKKKRKHLLTEYEWQFLRETKCVCLMKELAYDGHARLYIICNSSVKKVHMLSAF